MIVAKMLAIVSTFDAVSYSDCDRNKNPSRFTNIADVAMTLPVTKARLVKVIEAVLLFTI